MSFIILGASGHIGSVVAKELLSRGEAITVVLRDAKKSPDWEQLGAQVAVVDVHDTGALHKVFQGGKRLFLLNPPADPSTDTAVEERKTVFSILAALDGSGLEKIVAQSTYGAQQGERIGDLGVLHEMEQALAMQPIPATILRGAYYMSNWDGYLEMAQNEGKVTSFYPVDFKLPMVAPHDIGFFAAKLLTEPTESTGLHEIEGPSLYSVSDVAVAFSEALQKPVQPIETPRDQWIPVLIGLGFSEKSAESFVAMTDLTLQAKQPIAKNPTRGAITLQQYINQLVTGQKVTRW